MATITFDQHAPIDSFEVVGEELAIGGIPLTRLVARVGQTPFYAYSRNAIIQRVAMLRASIPHGVELHYAIKANPMPAVVQLLAGLTDGLDVASSREMQVAIATGTAPDRISFAGPGKTPLEIEQAVAAGVTINLESERQASQALAAGARLGLQPKVAIRVNPSFELKGAGMRMGGGAKAFGIDEDRVPPLAAALESAGVVLQGFHIFCGSQNLDASAISEAQVRSVELGKKLCSGLRQGISWLNIGGGFGVPYFPGERHLDLAPIGETLGKLAADAKATLGVPLMLELGRYLVAEAGVYVCRVLDRKVSHGQTFLVADGGLHHHLAASGNFGQVLRKNYPVAIGNRMGGEHALETQTVVGPLCTPLDLLADRMMLPSAGADDYVVIFRSGAYGLTASPAAFLSHPPAVEVLV